VSLTFLHASFSKSQTIDEHPHPQAIGLAVLALLEV
jgi:hypothetical protein